jgi:hypothetical protein
MLRTHKRGGRPLSEFFFLFLILVCFFIDVAYSCSFTRLGYHGYDARFLHDWRCLGLEY